MSPTRLSIALDTRPTLPTSTAEDYQDLQRKLSAGHTPAPSDLDPMADPRRDNPHQTRHRSKTDRVLRLLDSLETETTNRRCHH